MEIAKIGKVLAAVIVTMLVMTLGVVVAMLVFAGRSNADPNNPADQQSYFKSVEMQGVSGPHDGLLTLGNDVCAVQHTGMDPGEIEQYLRTKAPITTDIANVIRIAAELHLC